MAIIRSKIARQLLAEGGAPRRQGYLIGGLLKRAEEAKKANEQALRMYNNELPTVESIGGAPNVEGGSIVYDLGNNEYIYRSPVGFELVNPQGVYTSLGSGEGSAQSLEDLFDSGVVLRRANDPVLLAQQAAEATPTTTTPTTTTPTAEPERTGLGRVASIVQKAIQERQPEKFAANVMMDERGNVMRDQGIPDFLRQMGRGSAVRLDDPAPIRNISDVFRLAGISDQGIGSIGMDQSYEENQAINEQRRLANQRFRSAASDLLARGDSVTNEDIFRFGDTLGVSPDITAKVLSGVQSMGLPESGLDPRGLPFSGLPMGIMPPSDTAGMRGGFEGGVTLDGRTFQNEQDAIAGLGIERYNQLMATGGRVNLKGGGVSLDTAKKMAPKGEFLAYINPKEAQMLKDAGGSGIMTSMGIPSFTEDEEDQIAMDAPDYSSLDNEEQQAVDRGDPSAIMSTTSRDLQGYGPGDNLSDLSAPDSGIFGTGITKTDLFLGAVAPPVFAVKKIADILGISDRDAKFKDPTRDPDDDGDNDNQIVKPFMPIIPKKPSDITEEQSDFVQRFILPEAYRLRAADGGLASLQPRQELFVGGIADAVEGAVKGVTSGVKKVLKSDLGKAALTAAAIYYAPAMFGGTAGFGQGSTYRNFFSGLGGLDSIPGGGVTATILGTSLLGGLLTSKQPEQDIDALSSRISDQTGIDVAKIRAEVQQAYRDKDTSKLAKKYPFLVPEESALAYDKGGRVGFKNGTKENGVEEVEKEKPMTPEEYFQGKKKFNKKKMLEDMEDEYREYLDRQKYGPRNEAAGGGIMSQ